MTLHKSRITRRFEDTTDDSLVPALIDLNALTLLPPTRESATTVLNISEITNRIIRYFWDLEAFPLKYQYERIGTDVLWVYHKIAILFVETHRSDIQLENTLFVYTEDLYSNGGEIVRKDAKVQNEPIERGRQKKRITPNLVVPSSQSSTIFPFMCHPCDDYTTAPISELPISTWKVDQQTIATLIFNSASLAFFFTGYLCRITTNDKDRRYHRTLLFNIITLLSRFRYSGVALKLYYTDFTIAYLSHESFWESMIH